MAARPGRALSAYYLATPLFVALDLFAGANLRATFLDESSLRFLYYAGLFGIGAAGWWRPAAAPILGMLESAANVALVIIGLYTRVLDAGDADLAGATLPDLTVRSVMNAALSGAVFTWSFYSSQARVIAGRGGSPR